MGKVIAIILCILLYIAFAICYNISLYNGLKESWKHKDWILAYFCLGLFLTEIIFVLGIVCYYSQIA